VVRAHRVYHGCSGAAEARAAAERGSRCPCTGREGRVGSRKARTGGARVMRAACPWWRRDSAAEGSSSRHLRVDQHAASRRKSHVWGNALGALRPSRLRSGLAKQTTITAKHLSLLACAPCSFTAQRHVTNMADITALSQLLDASLDPRRNKEGKSLLFTHTARSATPVMRLSYHSPTCHSLSGDKHGGETRDARQAATAELPLPYSLRTCVQHFSAPMLTSPSGGSNLARAGKARLLPQPASHRRVAIRSAEHPARRRPLLQKLHKAQLGRRGWQLQAAQR
jgi:hypothetical protein